MHACMYIYIPVYIQEWEAIGVCVVQVNCRNVDKKGKRRKGKRNEERGKQNPLLAPQVHVHVYILTRYVKFHTHRSLSLQ